MLLSDHLCLAPGIVRNVPSEGVGGGWYEVLCECQFDLFAVKRKWTSGLGVCLICSPMYAGGLSLPVMFRCSGKLIEFKVNCLDRSH